MTSMRKEKKRIKPNFSTLVVCILVKWKCCWVRGVKGLGVCVLWRVTCTEYIYGVTGYLYL